MYCTRHDSRRKNSLAIVIEVKMTSNLKLIRNAVMSFNKWVASRDIQLFRVFLSQRSLGMMPSANFKLKSTNVNVIISR